MVSWIRSDAQVVMFYFLSGSTVEIRQNQMEWKRYVALAKYKWKQGGEMRTEREKEHSSDNIMQSIVMNICEKGARNMIHKRIEQEFSP